MPCETRAEKQKKRYKAIASNLPIIPGVVVSDEGDLTDISDIFGVATTEEDPQTAKARGFSPFIRDTVALQDGKSCSLVDILYKYKKEIDDASEVFTSELRLDYAPLTEEDWEVETAGAIKVLDIDEVERNIPDVGEVGKYVRAKISKPLKEVEDRIDEINLSLQQETERAKEEEEKISSALTEEVSRATGVEASLSSRLLQEVGNRKNAVLGLESSIEEEKTRATQEEGKLSASISSLTDTVNDISAVTEQEIDSLFTEEQNA